MSLKSNIWKMYAFNFFRHQFFVGGVIIPFFLDWGGITFTQVMLLQSFYVLSVFLLEVPTGAVADRFGRKTSLTLSAVAGIMAAIIYSIQPAYWVFFIGEFFWALGFSLVSGADQAFVYDTLKQLKREKDSKRIFGRLGSFPLIGLVFATSMGGIIAATLGLRYTMLLVAIPLVVSFIISITLEEPKVRHKNKPYGYFRTLTNGIHYFRKHTILKILAFDAISIWALSFFVFWTAQPLMMILAVPIIYFGFVNSAMAGMEVLAMNNFARLERWSGSKRNFMAYSAIIPGLGFITLSMTDYVPAVMILFILIAGFGMSRQVLISNYMNKHIPSHNRATVMSTVSMLTKLTSAILYPIVGLLVEYSLNWTFILLGSAILIASVFSRVKEEHLID
ncbi:MAG: MFS transporter [Nanoarchaeota archaeon]|nr:MFS transporter [Nanoarchaeota archaeon]